MGAIKKPSGCSADWLGSIGIGVTDLEKMFEEGICIPAPWVLAGKPRTAEQEPCPGVVVTALWVSSWPCRDALSRSHPRGGC